MLWQEIIADFGNSKKQITSYTEHFLERLLERSVKLSGAVAAETRPARNAKTTKGA
jgi:hypothetical protein